MASNFVADVFDLLQRFGLYLCEPFRRAVSLVGLEIRDTISDQVNLANIAFDSFESAGFHLSCIADVDHEV